MPRVAWASKTWELPWPRRWSASPYGDTVIHCQRRWCNPGDNFQTSSLGLLVPTRFRVVGGCCYSYKNGEKSYITTPIHARKYMAFTEVNKKNYKNRGFFHPITGVARPILTPQRRTVGWSPKTCPLRIPLQQDLLFAGGWVPGSLKFVWKNYICPGFWGNYPYWHKGPYEQVGMLVRWEFLHFYVEKIRHRRCD